MDDLPFTLSTDLYALLLRIAFVSVLSLVDMNVLSPARPIAVFLFVHTDFLAFTLRAGLGEGRDVGFSTFPSDARSLAG